MAVLLGGPASSPQVMDRRRVELADPKVPGSVQPFHAGLGLPRAAAAKTIGRLVKAVEHFSARSLGELLDEYRAQGHRITGAGLVVGSLIDPATIPNDHIRAHAEEGRLFRIVIEAALKSARFKISVTTEKKLMAVALRTLRQPESTLKSKLIAMGRHVDGSWRAEEKAATLAAWMATKR